MLSEFTVGTASMAQAREELRAVLESNTFRQAPKLGNLLHYLCNKALEQDERVTEYMIAVDVLGRDQDFKDSKDSNARVEVYRLRKKLAQFYEGEGKNRAIRILIRVGGYTPEFIPADLVVDNIATPSARPAVIPVVEHAAPASEEPRSATPSSNEVKVETPVPEPVQPTSIATRRWVLPLVMVAAFVLCVGLWLARKTGAANAAGPANSGAQTVANAPFNAAASATPFQPLRILAGYSGGPLSDDAGDTWGPDRYSTAGRPYSWGSVRVWRTNKQLLFQHARIGEVAYAIPLPPGVYELHLFLSEPEYTPEFGRGEGDRTFVLHLNSERLQPAIDIESDAMGANTADEKVVRDVGPAADGKLHISLETSLGVPLLNALEVLPGTRGRQLPIRIVARSAPYTDHSGNVWQPDNYYLNGQTVPRNQMVAGTSDPGLFTSERYGHFSYAIPVDIRDKYSVTLHFAELYFRPSGPAGSAGSRVFKVICNGATLLDNFDVLKLAGPAHELTETFHQIKPSAQGKLNLTFEPITNYAVVSAIEVDDDSK